jgi:SSS family solute:Na+ symporter
MGSIAAAGALAALIPASALLLGAASTFTKNVLGTLGIATGDVARIRATRALVLVVAMMALALWLLAQGATIVELLLLYYNGITQFMPSFVAAFLWRRATAWGVAAGIAMGLLAVLLLSNDHVWLWGVNPGFAGLFVNVVVLVTVSLLTPRRNEPAASAASPATSTG